MNNADPDQPLLSVRHLAVSYQDTPVVSDATFNVWPHQIVAMVGPNGAGKTTILKAVAGLIRPVRGEILYQNIPIHSLDVADVVSLGVVYVPEGMKVFPDMSVRENLEVGAYLNRAHIPERLRLVLCLFPELTSRMEAPAGGLSGGEKRMVTLARGLMAGARLLLLDDPFLGLGPKVVQRFCSAFQKLRKSGVTLLIAGQHVRRILRVADLAFLIEDGSITLQGPGPDILKNHHLRRILFGHAPKP